ncbi:hypothetical protein HRbin11_01493 [bacterium HR11]|nr:hypothetical protein HRbin11_01493 [bacterium HR11]
MSVPVEKTVGRMTFEEFLDWLDEDTWAEWVDGEVIMLSPASLPHQRFAKFLTIIMDAIAEATDAGIVLTAPFLMRLPTRPSGREPDILFVRKEHLDRLRDHYLDGPADLVVEVASSDSIGRDRGEKFVEYEAAGVAEYWLVDPDRGQVEACHLGTDGRYHPIRPDRRGWLHSVELVGFRLNPAWVSQTPPPAAATARRLVRRLRP